LLETDQDFFSQDQNFFNTMTSVSVLKAPKTNNMVSRTTSLPNKYTKTQK